MPQKCKDQGHRLQISANKLKFRTNKMFKNLLLIGITFLLHYAAQCNKNVMPINNKFLNILFVLNFNLFALICNSAHFWLYFSYNFCFFLFSLFKSIFIKSRKFVSNHTHTIFWKHWGHYAPNVSNQKFCKHQGPMEPLGAHWCT